MGDLQVKIWAAYLMSLNSDTFLSESCVAFVTAAA
jgi:hypothetical protein